MKISPLFLLAALFTLQWASFALATTQRPNILLLLVDDLKPAIGCYGDPVANTPCIDALADRGMRFDLAFCNQAVCAPSRFTLMLGSHSTSTGLYGLGSQLRRIVPDAATMPQHFGRHGYRTESLGKVFHIGHGNRGDPQSFSVPHFHEKVIEYVDPASTDGGQLTREEAYFTNQQLDRIRSLPRGAAFENPVAEDVAYADGRVAEETRRRLQAAKQRREQHGTPFFMVAGFARPHLPFSAPQKYWDRYDPNDLPMPEFERLPKGAPAVAGKRGGEITNYAPVPTDGDIDAPLKRQLIHGYYASVSYVDAQIGKVVDELDRLGLADDTIIVLWGDHGFHLGDLGIWTKHTNYEQATRIPLIIAAPGVTAPGSATAQLAESVDLFPTLADLAGLPPPQGPQPIDGVSLAPVMRDPAARIRDHAFHAYPKAQLGRAIRTERYRMVEWKQPGDDPSNAQYELYDYRTDPLERRNLAADQPEVLERLQRILARYPEAVSNGGGGSDRPRRAASPPNGASSARADVATRRQQIKAGLQSRDRPQLIKRGWIRDPYITLGPDEYYYLTGTTANLDNPAAKAEPYNTGLGDHSIVGWKARVWRSRDLVDWQPLGTPFTLKDGIWFEQQPNRFANVDPADWRLWAPELHWIGRRWALVHTSPSPVQGANLALTSGPQVQGPWENPMGTEIGRRHDPSLFNDDGQWWLVWGATQIAPLTSDFTGFRAKPTRIGPSGEHAKMGHEGCLIRKIHGRYVLFGTDWSTGRMRRGSYNLYYATAERITGPYGERRFAGRFLGHGTPFQDKQGQWWCTAFYNANVPPLPVDGIESKDLSETAQTINQQGVTLVPLDVQSRDDGHLHIRALAAGYDRPGPDEAQQFHD